jgi:hypothetical protein
MTNKDEMNLDVPGFIGELNLTIPTTCVEARKASDPTRLDPPRTPS